MELSGPPSPLSQRVAESGGYLGVRQTFPSTLADLGEPRVWPEWGNAASGRDHFRCGELGAAARATEWRVDYREWRRIGHRERRIDRGCREPPTGESCLALAQRRQWRFHRPLEALFDDELGLAVSEQNQHGFQPRRDQ
jgi:hypothetical protein